MAKTLKTALQRLSAQVNHAVKGVPTTRIDAVLKRCADQGLGIYVLNNNTIEIDDRIERTVYAICAIENNEHVTIAVPSTWVPINLLDSANRNTVVNSRHFRHALSSGRIILLDPEDAHKVLDGHEARIEYERAMTSVRNVDHTEQAQAEREAERANDDARDKLVVRTISPTDEEKFADSCSPKVIDICMRQADKQDVNEVRAFLNNDGDSLSRNDISYLNSNLPAPVLANASISALLTNLAGELA